MANPFADLIPEEKPSSPFADIVSTPTAKPTNPFADLVQDRPGPLEAVTDVFARGFKGVVDVFTSRPEESVFKAGFGWEEKGSELKKKALALNEKVVPEVVVPGSPVATTILSIPHVASEMVIEGIPTTPAETALAAAIGAIGPVARLGIKKLAATPQGKEIADKVPDTINIAETPGIVNGGAKERKFITTVKASPLTAPEVGIKIEGQYIPRSTDKLSRDARKLIGEDITKARDIALQGADDQAIATSVELIHHYQNAGDFDAAIALINQTAPKLTELGRAVQAASLYNKLSPSGIVRYAQKVIKAAQEEKPKLNIPDLPAAEAKKLFDLADQIQKMPEGTQKSIAMHNLIDKVNSYVPSTTGEKAVTLWKAGLLTGLKTTGVNILSNLTHGAAEIVKDIPAAVVDSVASLFTGKRTTAFTTRGILGGIKEGFEKGWQFLRTGFDERNSLQKYDYKKVNFGKGPVARALQKYEETIFRVISAEDQPFYYGQKARSLYAQATAEAMNKGYQGAMRAKFIDDFVANPPEQALKNAVNDAQIAVFQNKTLIGQAAQGLKKIGAAGEVIAPFRQTPASVAMQTLNYSPFGIVKTIVENIGKGRFDQRELAQGLGRGITGTGLFAIGAVLAKSGMMTLNAPKSDAERRLWELEGRSPNAVKIGGKWRKAGTLGPIGLTLLVGGHYQNAYKQTGSKVAALTQAVAGLGRSVIDQTFLQGVSGLLDALNDPERFAGGFVTNLSGSVVPTIVSDVARAADPLQRVVRDKGSVLDSSINAVGARIPGAREYLLPRRDIFGEEMARQRIPAGEMIDVFRSSPEMNQLDPVVLELRRLADAGQEAVPSSIDQKLKIADAEIELEPEQLNALQAIVGQRLKREYQRIIGNPAYDKLEDDEKKRMLENAADDIRKAEIWKYASKNKLAPKKELAVALSRMGAVEKKYLLTGDLTVKMPSTARKQNEKVIRKVFE